MGTAKWLTQWGHIFGSLQSNAVKCNVAHDSLEILFYICPKWQDFLLFPTMQQDNWCLEYNSFKLIQWHKCTRDFKGNGNVNW